MKKNSISRDSDILYSSLLLFTSGILIFQGWRLDPILLFGQFLISILLVFTLVENIYLRTKILNSSEFIPENLFNNMFIGSNKKGSLQTKTLKKSKKNLNKKSWMPIDWQEIKTESPKIKDVDFF